MSILAMPAPFTLNLEGNYYYIYVVPGIHTKTNSVRIIDAINALLGKTPAEKANLIKYFVDNAVSILSSLYFLELDSGLIYPDGTLLTFNKDFTKTKEITLTKSPTDDKGGPVPFGLPFYSYFNNTLQITYRFILNGTTQTYYIAPSNSGLIGNTALPSRDLMFFTSAKQFTNTDIGGSKISSGAKNNVGEYIHFESYVKIDLGTITIKVKLQTSISLIGTRMYTLDGIEVSHSALPNAILISPELLAHSLSLKKI